ncbi:glycosyl transferase [Candidatus Parcubacteria bacterium]|nr:glycosyl transferase [Candidatus Parcubacteria bacterium]
MKYDFCTLFDRNYLTRGLALYNSLLEHCSDFNLWILCMDDIAYDLLDKMNLEKAKLIKLSDFEDEKLLAIKSGRGAGEYCWTCTSSLIFYILKKHPDMDMVAYLDADMYFYSSPKPVYEEFGDNSVMIIPHRFSPEQKYLKKEKGIFNVGMVIVRNDKHGLECVEWWRERCIEWCFDYYEDGKLGDQLYLNCWPEKFKGVHILRHKGANLAPWNVGQYRVTKKDKNIFVDFDILIFYHFHSLKIYPGFKLQMCNFAYDISINKRKLIYTPYIEGLKKAMEQIKVVDPEFNYGFSPTPPVLQRMIFNSNFGKIHTALKKRSSLYNKFYKFMNAKFFKS